MQACVDGIVTGVAFARATVIVLAGDRVRRHE